MLAFAEAFLAREIPVSYQIIPARLTDACADYLLAIERARPDLIEFGQQDQTLFLVMPLAREGTLRDLLKQRNGPLPLAAEEALRTPLQ